MTPRARHKVLTARLASAPPQQLRVLLVALVRASCQQLTA